MKGFKMTYLEFNTILVKAKMLLKGKLGLFATAR